ncbi:LysR substrate-binding domain-containing protein [Photobacterium profundum]|uniref:LysR substrate-binding domain-containing protein n=1 Tax=Photobacterium profundum TaxID=74109 RepID=UPI000321A571|nr:LysR substrate-binding domain-containing protein [Photobacterium profundum]
MIRLKGNVLAGLATFETAARFGSFTQAAEHLHITTGAISQQISHLEQELSFVLFERHSRGIHLTDEGNQLYRVVNQSLADIRDVINQIQKAHHADGEIHLKLTPSFAFKWLVPRLHDFYTQYPDIKIHTFAEGALVDHNDTNFDLAIDYGQTPYIQTRNKSQISLLMAEKLLPVMSPDYMKKFDWNNPQDTSQNIWEKVRLLHDAMPWRHAAKDDEWCFWFKENGLTPLNLNTSRQHGHYFNRTDMAMAAAAAGLGVALARCALVEEDFSKGNLVSPFEPLDAKAGYYLIQHHHSPAIECFKAWLRQQVNRYGCSGSGTCL